MTLATLLAEVRATLARVPDPAGAAIAARLHHGAGMPVVPCTNPVVDRWLTPALDAATVEPALVAAIRAAAGALRWIAYDSYPPDRIGPAFRNGNAYALLISPQGAPFAAQDFDAGLFLMAPDLLYPDHRHAAPELYLPLTGPHGWRFDATGDFMALPAGAPVWNPSQRVHAMMTGAVPFLALYVWTRDVAAAAELV